MILQTEQHVQRKFIIGEEWLYYKVYCGSKTADYIISELVQPLAQQLVDAAIIDQWFFIRYADPDPHLRIRFHCKKPEHLLVVIQEFSRLCKSLVQQDLIWNIQTDIYQRELERYGSNSMVLSEQLFFHESTMLSHFIRVNQEEDKENYRWLFALRAIDVHLDNFGYNLSEKHQLLERLKIGYRREFDESSFLGKQLSQKYRKQRKNITAFLSKDFAVNFPHFHQVLTQYQQQVQPVVAQLIALKQQNNLQVDFNDLNASYIHMLLNRLFKSKNRLNEMVCYDFMFTHYKSALARERHRK